ncbi:MAG: DUF4215 domain-containing protein [Myxococcales bacterium]|nr:DUF4215 domain-containing protein [Myxococcales bacterium]
MPSLLRTAPACLVLAFLAACDDPALPDGPTSTSGATGGGGESGEGAAGAGGAGGTPDPGPCPVMNVSDTTLDFYTAGLFAVSARVDTPVEGYAKTRLTFELYFGPEGNWPTPGTFDLSVSPDDDYGTCEHCVLLVAFDEAGQPRRAFFQESGTMELTHYDPDQIGIAAGAIEDARLVEVIQSAEDGSWSVVPGGLCFDLPAWSFDTRVVHGGACDTLEDCPNEAMQSCDVETKTCQPFECSIFGDPPFCGDGYRCLSQYQTLIDREESGPASGACYEACSPGPAGTTGSCEAGSMCFPLDATQTAGICLATGGPAVGEACTLSDVATGCAEGGLCVGEPPTCRAVCDYLSATSECPSGTYCTTLNLCEPLEVGDVAPVGAYCEPGAATLTDCGPEGEAFRGLCFRLFETVEDAVCARTCEMADPECPGGLSCIGVFTNAEVGICADPGACGDGALDLLGAEVCDDGNTVSGDGCSADCSAAELAPLCAMAEPLSVGDAIVDTNEGGVTGYVSLCDPFIADPAKTFSFLPPAPGELTLRLTSVPNLGVSVLGDCLDAGSELGCRMDDGQDVLRVNFATVPSQPALVVVRGANPLETGLFVLESEFAVSACGDLLVNGPEACDDGNQSSGDGCSADCSAIEWPALCAGLPAIQDGDVIQGTLAAAAPFFDLTGVCSYDSGNDRAFSFVAPSDGTLEVELVSEDDLVVYLGDGCGPVDPATYLSCGNSGQAGQSETASALLSAGQVVTVVVDGFTPEEASTFTLTASFSP